MSKYLILEKGSYDDYQVEILDVSTTNLTNKEIIKVLNCEGWSPYKVSGTINGTVKGWTCLDLFNSATESINAMFCCYDNKKYKTVLDKLYSKDELLEIATANDNSSLHYWVEEIEKRYKNYVECYQIYQKLAPNPKTKDKER